ncbi:MFS transporter [Pseudonocardia sp. KRD-184]|uniref:MFS transporter n=1 Tax=Pseudonocardia oceani TaxID=2792013 RepID=A0ABS6UCF0_9PSEU|nr:MFS transporter [Pseudonocardia oceani]MBW0092078.1 MFS transporter [Pseudonocardia oceani]MBW0096730.1 MFS transporter [Pseudonocardia oceani]MBW0112260.1 MFS transporter [Pseudonocardia oceani]MBW0121742.1 MFS transporter [Pseudonocardia oceani]MBW0129902.1 MFS transporter [Pseudonocardia oceani]
MVEVDAPRAPARLPREIWVLVGASFLIAIGFGLVAPTLPVFVRSFDVGIAAAGLVISVFALARLVFAPSSGWLVGRIGELRVFNAGLLIVAVSTAAMAFAGEYWHLLALRAFGGIGSTMFTISAVSLLIRLSPPEIRGRASGMWATGFLLGNIVGPLAGGGLVAISLRAPFLVYAAVLVVVVVVSGVLLRGRTDVAAPVPGAAPVTTVTFREALRHRTYRAALVANFGVGWAVFGARVALVPLLVVEALGQPEAWSGIALAVFAAGNAATLVVSGRFADRFGRRPPMLLGLAVAAVGTGVLGYVEDPVLFLAVSLVAGLGSGLVNPPLQAAVGDVIGTGGRGGTVLAGFQMASDTGAILGPVLAGGLAELVGYGPAFGITGVVLAVGWAFWLRAPETLPRLVEPPVTVSCPET